jgi:hypothetical protein
MNTMKVKTFDKAIVMDDGIELNKSSEKLILHWNEIVSMSTIHDLSEFLKYEIRSTDFSARFPPPDDWKMFEATVEKKASLELVGVNAAVVAIGNTPEIKRWKKIGGEYVNTSTTDWIQGAGYSNEKTHIKKVAFGILAFIAALLAMWIISKTGE